MDESNGKRIGRNPLDEGMTGVELKKERKDEKETRKT